MLSCPEKMQISAFLDGEISAESCRAIESHLQTCPKCAKIAASFRAASTAVSDDGIFIDDSFKSESLKNLKIKMRFKKSTRFEQKKRSEFSLATAAAIFIAFAPLFSLAKNESRNFSPEFDRTRQSPYFSQNFGISGASFDGGGMPFDRRYVAPYEFASIPQKRNFYSRRRGHFHRPPDDFQSRPMSRSVFSDDEFEPFFWNESPIFFQDAPLLSMPIGVQTESFPAAKDDAQ